MLLGGDRDELKYYIRELADLMGLSEWRLTLLDDDCPPENGADVSITYGQQAAAIRIDGEWATFTPERLRHFVVHELVHCHVEKMSWAIENVKDALGYIGWNLYHLSIKDAEEQTVDNIAYAWATRLPLPGET